MPYKKIKEIGRGGFGRVFEVENEKGVKFALKEYEPDNTIQSLINQGLVKPENLKGRS